MRKNKARKLINKLLVEVEDINNVKDQSWRDKALGYIRVIFGGHDESIASPMYEYYYGDKGDWDTEKAERIQPKFRIIFKTYIELIDDGARVPKNIFSRFNDLEVFALIVSIGGLLLSFVYGLTYSVAYNDGQKLAECQKIECYNQCNKLRDSLNFIHNEYNKIKAEHEQSKAASNNKKIVRPKPLRETK